MNIPARIAVSLAVLMLMGPVAATAQDKSSQQGRKELLEQEIREIESQLNANSSRRSSALAELALVRQKIQAQKELLAESERELKAVDDSLTACRRQADAIQQRLDTMVFYYGRLIRNAYKNRDAKVWYMYLLASDNIAQAGRRYAYLRNLSGQMKQQSGKIKEARAELEVRLRELGTLQEKAVKARDEQSRAMASLKSEELRQEKTIGRLQNEKTRYQKLLATRRKQVEALDGELKKIINSGRKVSQKPEDFKLSGEFEANKGRLPWPAPGRITDSFGQHYHPVYKSVKLPFNNGVGISVARGTEARVVFDGEVKRVIVMPGYNKCVLVQHGGYFTFYCKLSSVSVKARDKLKAGQTVGVIDTIDGQTQLHFQIWKGTDPLNPESWLKPRD